MPTPPTTSATNLRRLLDGGERVFSSHPQVSCYHPSAAMEDARRRIRRAIDRGDGPALVVGAAGTGKSLLLQVLAAQYRDRFDVVLLACARICTRRALLQTILFELGLPYRQRDEGQLRLGLLDHLLSEKLSPAGLLLLVDEAQSLSIALLDELRVLTNLMRGGVPRVRLVLAGSSAIEESFAGPELESFSQRLSARCYLAPLSREETAQFVRAQLAAARVAPESAFAADAYDAVFDATDGVPRLVNQVCDRALLLAGEESRSLIDRQVIQAAWADLQQLPTAWSTPRASTAPAPTSHVIEFGSLDDAPTNSPAPTTIEPTAPLWHVVDDIELVAQADVNAAPQEDSEQVASVPPKQPHRAPRNSPDPFAEQFDEEEVVLDSFAAWDEMFHAGTPRVENCRERSLTTQIQAALEASPCPEHCPPEPAFYRDDTNTDQSELADADSAVGATLPDESPTNWPRLRLAVVSESAGPEPVPTDPAPVLVVPVTRTRNDLPVAVEGPILLIEDETEAADYAAPPVRRLAYQHLFSRLRSG